MRNRRDFHRVTQPVTGRYRLSNQIVAPWTSITIINLSAGGLRFRGEELLEQDAPIEVETHVPGMSAVLFVKGRVAWSSLQASGVTETGVQFLDVTIEQKFRIDKMVEFLRSTAPPPQADA